jgi:hypothetical protein
MHAAYPTIGGMFAFEHIAVNGMKVFISSIAEPAGPPPRTRPVCPGATAEIRLSLPPQFGEGGERPHAFDEIKTPRKKAAGTDPAAVVPSG